MAEDLDRLASLVYHRASAIEGTFSRLRARDFPTYHFETLAAFPQKAALQIRYAVNSWLRLARTGASTKGVGRMLRRYGQALEYVHESLGFMVNAEVLSIPAPFVLFLEELGSEYLEPRFVLQGAPEFNYSFMSVARRLNAPLIQAGVAARLDEGFAVFRFPAALREDGLQHNILAHELGHYIDTREHLYQRAWQNATPNVQRRVRGFLRTQMGTVRGGIDALSGNALAEILRNWIVETVCDIFAARVLGPAYLFSSVEFVRFQPDLSKGSDSHPPSAFRLWVIYEELRSLGWSAEQLDSVFDQPPSKPDRWTRERIRAIDRSGRYLRVMERCLGELLPAIRRTIRDFVGARSYSRSEYDEHADEVRGLFTHLIPPGESLDGGTERAIPARAILNGGWFFHLKGYPSWPVLRRSPLRAASERRELLSRLTLKALEISYVVKHWPNMPGGRDDRPEP